MEPFHRLLAAFNSAGVRYVVIGVSGANYWALDAGHSFVTKDRDLFLPLDPHNELAAWKVCLALGLSLWCGDEPLDQPGDADLSERVVRSRTLVTATDDNDLVVDLSLVMGDFDFDTIWSERRVFIGEGVEIPVARLKSIVESKRRAGRDKDKLFLATHEDALRQMFRKHDE